MNIRRIYKKRKKWSQKGDFGKVLVVSGSKIYSGSPIFNAVSALRCGADIVEIMGHKRAMDVVAAYLPDLITHPLEFDLNLYHVGEVVELSKKFDSMVIGCGLQRSEDTYRAIRDIIKHSQLPTVIDAEAIRAVSENPEILKGKKTIVTPHAEEFRVLTGKRIKNDSADRREAVKKCAKKIGAAIILKGNVDVISSGNKTALNKTGTPFMTKGGFGDTLAGICGALLARGCEPYEAACFGAYVNGKAGELASKKYKESLLASDIFEFISMIVNSKK